MGSKNEHVKTKNVFQMKISTYTIMYQANFAGRHIELKMYPAKFPTSDIETIMYPAKFAGGRSRLDLLLPSFLPSREEKKKQERRKQSIDSGAEWHNLHMNRVRIETNKQERIFCPLRGHAVGRMQYAPTSCRQEMLFPINSQEERTETKIQEQKDRPLGSRGVLHTPNTDRVRTETKMQERRKQSIDSGAELHTPHMDRVRIETKMQERIKQSIDSSAEWHTPFMRQGERDAVWRDTFLEQRARVAIWQDRHLEEKSSHARFQMRISGENSNPYKSSLVALSEQLRDIFAA